MSPFTTMRLFLFLASLAIVGCQQVPVTGRSQFILVDESSGNTVAAAGASMAYPATMASASATAAPTGKSARLMKRRSLGRTSPSAPMASHAAIAAMTRDSGVAFIGARARQCSRGRRRVVRAASLDPHSGLRAGIG